MSGKARAGLTKGFFRSAIIIGVEYFAAMILVLFHHLTVSFKLYGETGELPSLFFEMFAIAFIGVVSLFFSPVWNMGGAIQSFQAVANWNCDCSAASGAINSLASRDSALDRTSLAGNRRCRVCR